MMSEDHKKNRIQMKWQDSKYIEPEGISEFEKAGLKSIAFIDTAQLNRMKAQVEKEGNLKRGFYTNAQWFSVIDTELKLRDKKVNTIVYHIANNIIKDNPPSKSCISTILKQIAEIK